MPIISKILKLSIVCLFFLFITVSYGQATTQKRSSKDKVLFTISSIYNGLTNFSFYSEDFLNTNFDVYKGNRYINNFCNTQDRFYIIDERQDNYNLLVKNGFGYTREQIAIINDKLNLLGLEIEFLKNLDVYQPFGYGEKIESGGNTINEFETQGLPKMFERLSPVFKKVFGVNPTQKQHKERLEGLIQMFVEKYSHRFNYYDQEGIKQNGDYHKDECLGGLAAITKKYESVKKGYQELGEVAQNSVGKEWTKLMKTVKKFWSTTKEAFSTKLYQDKLKKTYGFKDDKEYSGFDALKQVLSKTFPTVEKQIQQIKDTYGEKRDLNKNIGNKTQAKVEQIFQNSVNADQFSQYLSETSSFQDFVFLQSAIEEVSKRQAERQFSSLVNSQKSEVADFSALELASILDKTRQTIVRTNEIIGEKDPGSLFHNMKQVHEKQCKAE